MTHPPLAKLDAQFEALLALPEAAREAHLAGIADVDPGMGNSLRRLLQLMSDSDTRPLRALGAAALEKSDECAPPAIPGYRIERELGRGGMGAVFDAARDLGGGIWQPVAVKVLRRALLSDEELQRFISEQHILARLRHPNIAGLLDVGVADGRPWMALERIEGEPIDQCLQAPAAPVAVLRAVLQVTEALQQAHALLVVHRDIKPDNVLMDADGRVKLIDFGIAKQLDLELDQSLTRTGTAPLTLRYASPEQLLQKPVGVASDLYQLGLLMYQLLTGAWPWNDGAQQFPTQRTRPESEIVPPSKRMPLGPRRRALTGDIDAIILRCLQFEPHQRYGSAAELREDIERHLSHRPVRARRHTRWYLARGVLQRHRLAATIATFVLLLGALVLTAALQSAQRSREHAQSLASERNAALAAQDRAETIYEFMLDVIGSGDPENSEQRGKSIDEILADAVDRIAADSTLSPDVRSRLATDLGTALFRRGQLDDAERALRSAVEHYQASGQPASKEGMGAAQHLALVLHQLQRLDEARSVALTVLEDTRRQHGARSLVVTYLLKTLAIIESSSGDYSSAEARLREALAIDESLSDADRAAAQHLLEPGDPDWDNRTDILKNLGMQMMRQKRAEEAEPLLLEGEYMARKLYGDEHPRSLEAMLNHAAALRAVGRLDEAQAKLEIILAGQRKLYPSPNRVLAITLGTLANVATSAERFEQSAALWSEAESEAVGALGDDHPWIASVRLARARALHSAGNDAEASRILRALVALQDRDDDLVSRATALLGEIGK